MGSLTPLIMMAGQGLVENDALELNPEMLAEFATYTSHPFVARFAQMVADLEADERTIDPLDPEGTGPIPGTDPVEYYNPDGIPSSFVSPMLHMFDSTMPSLTDVIPLGSPLTATSFSTFVISHANDLFTTVNGKFLAHLLAVAGYVSTMNQYINSAVNGSELSVQTFSSMDALMSGNITAVNKFTQEFGQDLLNTGKVYSFDDLSKLGTPQSLLTTLASTNMLTTISTEMQVQDLDAQQIQDAINDNPDSEMRATIQKRSYDVFTTVTGKKLSDILIVLGVKTENITALSDLLDITKMFPNSYTTMTSLNSGALENIYTNGAISQYVADITTNNVLVMPDDIAKANLAFGISLQQIKNIHNLTPQALADQALAIETNNGLDEITSLTSALPADTTTFYTSTMSGGTAVDGTYYVTDGVGSVTGIPHVANFETINTIITDFENNGDLQELNNIFDVINDLITLTGSVQLTNNDPFNEEELIIENGYPAGGTVPPGIIYNNKTAEMIQLQIEADAAVATLETNYPTEVANANTAYQDSIDHVVLEQQTLLEADVDFATTRSTRDTILSFAANLHSFGTRTDKGDMAEILEAVVDTSTRGGQAIIGAMREGRNLKKLADAGIATDNKIDDTPSVTLPGNIAPSSY